MRGEGVHLWRSHLLKTDTPPAVPAGSTTGPKFNMIRTSLVRGSYITTQSVFPPTLIHLRRWCNLICGRRSWTLSPNHWSCPTSLGVTTDIDPGIIHPRPGWYEDQTREMFPTYRGQKIKRRTANWSCKPVRWARRKTHEVGVSLYYIGLVAGADAGYLWSRISNEKRCGSVDL